MRHFFLISAIFTWKRLSCLFNCLATFVKIHERSRFKQELTRTITRIGFINWGVDNLKFATVERFMSCLLTSHQRRTKVWKLFSSLYCFQWDRLEPHQINRRFFGAVSYQRLVNKGYSACASLQELVCGFQAVDRKIIMFFRCWKHELAQMLMIMNCISEKKCDRIECFEILNARRGHLFNKQPTSCDIVHSDWPVITAPPFLPLAVTLSW